MKSLYAKSHVDAAEKDTEKGRKSESDTRESGKRLKKRSEKMHREAKKMENGKCEVKEHFASHKTKQRSRNTRDQRIDSRR